MERIKVEDGNGNAVYIRGKKVGFGLRLRITSEATRMGGVADPWTLSLATLKCTIVEWEGPDLPPYKDGQIPSDEMLDDLDSDFGTKILEASNKVNGIETESPNEPTASGDSGSPDDERNSAENIVPISSLPTGKAGRKAS